MVRHIYHRVRPHLPQFGKYLMSGGSAAFLELSSYQLMLMAGMWYMPAATISSGIGLVSAFTFHKYFVFGKRENTGAHAMKFAVLQGMNAIAQIAFVFLFVEYFGIHEFIAKILGIGVVVSWNFFLYKFIVYK